jgi:hypothetical protein
VRLHFFPRSRKGKAGRDGINLSRLIYYLINLDFDNKRGESGLAQTADQTVEQTDSGINRSALFEHCARINYGSFMTQCEQTHNATRERECH